MSEINTSCICFTCQHGPNGDGQGCPKHNCMRVCVTIDKEAHNDQNVNTCNGFSACESFKQFLS